MGTIEKLLVGILVAVIAWFITNIIRYYLKRERLKGAILSDINYHILGIKENKGYLDALFERSIIEGKEIDYAAYYERDEYELYKCVQQDIVTFFSQKLLLNLLKFYRALLEYEVLMEGLMKDVTEWKKEKRSISKDDLDYLKRKKDRIVALINILSQKDIRKLEDLPGDYRGRIDAATLIK